MISLLNTITSVFITIATQCAPPNPISNGEYSVADNVARFACDNGYILRGDATQHCRYDGSWSSASPTCGKHIQ